MKAEWSVCTKLYLKGTHKRAKCHTGEKPEVEKAASVEMGGKKWKGSKGCAACSVFWFLLYMQPHSVPNSEKLKGARHLQIKGNALPSDSLMD